MLRIDESVSVLIDDKITKLKLKPPNINYFPDIRGFMLPVEKRILIHLAQQLPKNSKIVEIGCFWGKSTYFLCKGAQNSFVYSIDPFGLDRKKQDMLEKSQFFRNIYTNKPSKIQVERLLKKYKISNFQLIEGYSKDISEFWDKDIDLLFIDGNHSYDNVNSDFQNWSKFIKRGTRIIFHDSNYNVKSTIPLFGLPGPTRVVNAFLKPPLWKKLMRVASISTAVKNY